LLAEPVSHVLSFARSGQAGRLSHVVCLSQPNSEGYFWSDSSSFFTVSAVLPSCASPWSVYLHDQRNSPVRWINWILRLAQKLVGKAAHLGYLFLSQPLLLHQAARRIRAISGEFP